MVNKDFKRRIVYEVLTFFGLIALIMFITRIWALLLLVVLGILIAALRLLFMRADKAEVLIPQAIPESAPKQETEKDILRQAFSLIQRRITEDIEAMHPSARWQWFTPNTISHIEKDEPVTIILNGAGGYRKAIVQIHNLVYKGLLFETAPMSAEQSIPVDDCANKDQAEETDTVETDDQSDTMETDGQTDVMNYGYLAFEWVDERLLGLNERANEATLLLISSPMLSLTL